MQISQEIEFVLDHEAEALRALPPLSEMPVDVLKSVLMASRLVYFPQGAHVAHPDMLAQDSGLFVLKHGTLALYASEQQDHRFAGEPEMRLQPGALFGTEWAMGQRNPAYVYVAEADCYCWSLNAAAQTILEGFPSVWKWMMEESWNGLAQLRSRQAKDRESRYLAEQVLCQPLGTLFKRDPITVEPSMAAQAVLRLMAEQKIGSVVVQQDKKPVGIITETDLVRRLLVAEGADNKTAADIMTSEPAVLDATRTLAEAAMEMTSRGIRHVPVVDEEGCFLGMVSERDIFMRQRAGFGTLSAPIDQAESVEALVSVVASIREAGKAMFLQGMGAVQLTNLISSLNDRVGERILDLIASQANLPSRYCWLAFGSEGRMEQTFSTDQDNGLIFVPSSPDAVEAERAQYLAFADQVNRALDQVGFPLCKGNIMARNPEWCLTLDEWKAKFGRWIKSPTAVALLNSSIFFDFRSLHGDASLAETLRDYMFALSQENTIFLHMMAANALTAIPPLGKLSRFNVDKSKQGTVDLKTQGVRLFVDIARINSLKCAVRATNTIQRLRLGGQKLKRSPKLIEADIAAFEFIQAIRMGGQLLAPEGQDPNRVDPYALNELDQRVLQESFRQAQLLQERLKMDYRV